MRAGSEEYLDSEKYQLRERDLDGPLLPLIGRLNAIRREHPALQHFANVRFLDTHNDSLLAYAKREAQNLVIVVVNLDPHNAQEGLVTVPYELGTAPVIADDRSAGRRRSPLAPGRQLRAPGPGGASAHVLRVEAA